VRARRLRCWRRRGGERAFNHGRRQSSVERGGIGRSFAGCPGWLRGRFAATLDLSCSGNELLDGDGSILIEVETRAAHRAGAAEGRVQRRQQIDGRERFIAIAVG